MRACVRGGAHFPLSNHAGTLNNMSFFDCREGKDGLDVLELDKREKAQLLQVLLPQ